MATSSNRPTPLPHDDGLWIFLQNRGIPERNIQKMQQDRIDSTVVGEIDDATMAAYIPAYGDRVAARRFCVEKRSRGGDDQSRLSLFEKIKRKKGTPNNKDKDEDFDEEYSIHPAKAHLKNKGASKMTRKIELGWIHDRRQVRKRTGGGTKGLDISKKATKTEILSLAKKLFFPNEKSRRGKWEEFSHDIVDFQNVYLDEDVTVGELYEIHKPGILRLYLFTERLTNGDEAFTEIVETADKQTDTARSVEQQEDTTGDDEQQTQKTCDSEQQTHTVEDVAHGTTKMSACVSTAVEMVDLTVLHESDLPIKEEQINTNAYTSTPTHAEIVCAVPPSPAYEPCT